MHGERAYGPQTRAVLVTCRITELPAASVAGIAVKLRLFAHHTDSESGDFVHDFVLSALRDAERLAKEVQS